MLFEIKCSARAKCKGCVWLQQAVKGPAAKLQPHGRDPNRFSVQRDGPTGLERAFRNPRLQSLNLGGNKWLHETFCMGTIEINGPIGYRKEGFISHDWILILLLLWHLTCTFVALLNRGAVSCKPCMVLTKGLRRSMGAEGRTP